MSYDLLNQLQILQNSAARFIFGLPRFSHSSVLLDELHWLKINERIHFKLLIIVHNCIYNSNFSESLSSLLKISVERNMTLFIPRVHTSQGKKSFMYIGPKLWNSLPSYLRMVAEIDVFKRSLKYFLFRNSEQYFQSIRAI